MSERIEVPTEVCHKLEPWYGELPGEVPVLRGSLLGWAFGLIRQHAVTINGTVHWTSRAPELASLGGTALLGHELFHVLHQAEVGWWRYLAGYVCRWRPSHIRHGWEHPYEVDAYARGREIREALTPTTP